MKINIVAIEATPEEIDSSTVLADALARITGQAPADRGDDPHTVSAEDVEADDAAADLADAEAAETPAPTTPAAVPGVAGEGQAVVRGLLDHNPAGELFVQFLAETTSWPNVKAIGIKRKGHVPGTALDYSRYLRLRKQRSHFGGFAYVYAVDGLVNLRLTFASDAELAEIAPDAWLLEKGHREYRVSIRVTDESTLKQAVDLARMAYDRT
jgi:hypothetical protein